MKDLPLAAGQHYHHHHHHHLYAEDLLARTETRSSRWYVLHSIFPTHRLIMIEEYDLPQRPYAIPHSHFAMSEVAFERLGLCEHLRNSGAVAFGL